MPSISAIRRVAAGVGVPPTAAEGCSDSASWSEVATSWTTPFDVGGQCMTLGRCRTNGASGTFIDEQLRLEGVGDRAHGVLVLLEVLRRAGQGRGERQVALVVAGAADGAGEHAGGDQAALAPHQQSRGSPEDAVDVEGPAHLVLLGEAAQRPAHVDGLVGGGDEVAREHDLLQVALADAAHGLGDDRHPLLAVARAVGEDQPDRRRRPVGGASVGGAASAPTETVVSQVRSPRRPTTTCGTTRTESPGRRRTRRCRSRRARAGLADQVAHLGARHDLRPPLHRVAEPGRPGGLEAGCDAPADQALAAAQPADRLLAGEQVEELEVGQLDGTVRTTRVRRVRCWPRTRGSSRLRAYAAGTASGGQIGQKATDRGPRHLRCPDNPRTEEPHVSVHPSPLARLEHHARHRALDVALTEEREGRWTSLTWNELYRRVIDGAAGMIEAGVARGTCGARVPAGIRQVELELATRVAGAVPLLLPEHLDAARWDGCSTRSRCASWSSTTRAG